MVNLPSNATAVCSNTTSDKTDVFSEAMSSETVAAVVNQSSEAVVYSGLKSNETDVNEVAYCSPQSDEAVGAMVNLPSNATAVCSNTTSDKTDVFSEAMSSEVVVNQ